MMMIDVLRKVIKRRHYPLEVMLVCVRWYAAYPLSVRHIEEMMAERGVAVDHSTIHRWAVKIMPVLAAVFRGFKRPVGKSWRFDETYIQANGVWKYLYPGVDRDGQTVDFLLTAQRDLAAARRFFERAVDRHDLPESIAIDKSGANTAAVRSVIADTGADILLLRQNNCLNNLIEQDHRAVKRITRPMMGFITVLAHRLISIHQRVLMGPSVPGIVVRSELREKTSGDGTSYRADLACTKSAGGQQFTTARYTEGMQLSRPEQSARALVAAFPVGRVVDIRIEPADVAEGVLISGKLEHMGVIRGVGLAALVGGIFLAVYALLRGP